MKNVMPLSDWTVRALELRDGIDFQHPYAYINGNQCTVALCCENLSNGTGCSQIVVFHCVKILH